MLNDFDCFDVDDDDNVGNVDDDFGQKAKMSTIE